MTSLRDRLLTPRVARAMTSPSAIVLTGAGAAGAVVAGLGPAGAVAGGAVAYLLRVAASVPRQPRSARPAGDLRRLNEPWRALMADVLDAQRRYRSAVAGTPEGPMRDRMAGLGEQIDAGVAEAWHVAEAGNQLDLGRRSIDTSALPRQLAEAEAAAAAGNPTAAQTVVALRAQLDAAARLERTATETADRLRLLDARLDEAVTRTIELSLTGTATDELTWAATRDDLGGVVDDLESLRAAVEETRGTA